MHHWSIVLNFLACLAISVAGVQRGWAKGVHGKRGSTSAARDDNLIVTHSLQPLAWPWRLRRIDERATDELLMALKTQRRPVRTCSAIQPHVSITRVRSRWCAHTAISTQLGCGCRWRGLSRMFTIVLMLQSLVHCTVAAVVHSELAPFSGSGAGEIPDDSAPTQSPTVPTSTTASPRPPGGNRGTYCIKIVREHNDCTHRCMCISDRVYRMKGTVGVVY